MSCDSGPFLMKEWVECELLGARSEIQLCLFIEKRCKKKGIVSFPTRPDWGATDAAKKRAAFRSPTAPLGGGLRGYPAQAQGPGGCGEASELPHFLESSPVPRGPARASRVADGY